MDLTGFIAENLFSVHAFLASLSGKDILKIEKAEADELGTAIQNVARHYDIPGVNQVAVDWVRLARTLGMVYGFRLFAMRMQRAPAPPRPQPMTASEPAPMNGHDQAPPQSQVSQREAEGGTWASPGPGLPKVWVPNPRPN